MLTYYTYYNTGFVNDNISTVSWQHKNKMVLLNVPDIEYSTFLQVKFLVCQTQNVFTWIVVCLKKTPNQNTQS